MGDVAATNLRPMDSTATGIIVAIWALSVLTAPGSRDAAHPPVAADRSIFSGRGKYLFIN
jgi:hypothetical protein